MAEDLEGLYGRLSLTESEEEVVFVDEEVVRDTVRRGERCLIIQFLTLKHYNKEALKQMLRRIWRPAKMMHIQNLDSNFLIAEFDDVKDKERVVRDGLWTFDKQLALVKDFDGAQQTQMLHLTEASFWVRVHDLPLMARNETVGKLIGNALGIVEEIDLLEGELAWGEYLRIQVCMDITKPLLRGKKFCVGAHVPYWVRFSYERLPDFCYVCGRIGHAQQDCDQRESNDSHQGPLPYGQWLHGLGRGGKISEGSGHPQPSAVKGVPDPGSRKTCTVAEAVIETTMLKPLGADFLEIPNPPIKAINLTE
ncbi:uncharacterized protein LOC121262766 [Juglans microcarpa x Juglans regia]|uniref:uncharacterized protein LOC121262766 n=1 Tax=Juglans microcarpa x Juglans regia TaxID=2249226 RepID=UPI001B7E8BB5|nr:uncharacterized protein LOC121262766 [Juglans microcarpa x Juglans regia]